MRDIMNHAITVGDLAMAAGIGVILLLLALGFIVLAVNMGWVK